MDAEKIKKAGYHIDALEANVKRCDKNIRTFEEAIVKEVETKMGLKKMIRILKEEGS